MEKLKKLKLNAASLSHAEMKQIRGGNDGDLLICKASCDTAKFDSFAAIAVCESGATCTTVNDLGAFCIGEGGKVVSGVKCDGPYYPN